MFTNINKFDKQYVKRIVWIYYRSRNERELTDKIKHNLIIRTKEEVSSHLPKLVVAQKFCSLSKKTQAMSDKLLDEIKDLKAQQEVMLERFNSIEEARKNEEFNKIDNMILMKQTFCSRAYN